MARAAVVRLRSPGPFRYTSLGGGGGAFFVLPPLVSPACRRLLIPIQSMFVLLLTLSELYVPSGHADILYTLY